MGELRFPEAGLGLLWSGDAFDSFDDSEWLVPWCRMSTELLRF